MREVHILDGFARPYHILANFLYGELGLFTYNVIISAECDESELDYTTKWFPSESAMRDDPDFVEVVDDGEYVLGAVGAGAC